MIVFKVNLWNNVNYDYNKFVQACPICLTRNYGGFAVYLCENISLNFFVTYRPAY